MPHLEVGLRKEEVCPIWPRAPLKALFPDFYRFNRSILDKESETQPQEAFWYLFEAYRSGRLPEPDACFGVLVQHLAQMGAMTAEISADCNFHMEPFCGVDMQRLMGADGSLSCGSQSPDCTSGRYGNNLFLPGLVTGARGNADRLCRLGREAHAGSVRAHGLLHSAEEWYRTHAQVSQARTPPVAPRASAAPPPVALCCTARGGIDGVLNVQLVLALQGQVAIRPR